MRSDRLRARWLILLAVPAAALAQSPAAPPSGHAIDVRVDPRVELLSLVFRLAGHPEYNMPNSASAYSEEIEERFGKFREHAAVKRAAELRRTRGVSYDAVMSMAVHVDNITDLQERIPFDLPPERLDQRWHAAEAREFLADLRAFVRDSEFAGFVESKRAYYAAAAERLSRPIGARDHVAWFDKFFGPRQDANFTAIAGLLCGGGNYGVGIRWPDGREEITPVLGAYQFDNDGLPIYDGRHMMGLIAHELCHTYTNPFVDRHADRLQAAGETIYATCAEQMQSQAYGNWRTMLYESLVRAVTVRYEADLSGPQAEEQQVAYETSRGFRWTGRLAGLMKDYAADRTKYPDFEAFMPRVIDFFDRYAADPKSEPDKAAARPDAPQIVACTPADGATDVDAAACRALRVEFDRPMLDGSWSVVREGAAGVEYPESGNPRYDAARKVFTLDLTLKPGTRYRVWLNRGQFSGFRGERGAPLEPYRIEFATK